MAGNKYLSLNGGDITEVVANQSSAGADDAGKIVALDSTGHLDSSVLPTGIGADTASINATEALAAGDLVNIWDNSSAWGVRKADASAAGKEAHGFVLSAVTSGAAATVYFEGSDNQMSSLTPGVRFLSDVTPGATVGIAPTGSGKVVQRVGFSTSATAMNFESGVPVILA